MMMIDPGLELAGSWHGLTVEQANYPRIGPQFGQYVVELERLRMTKIEPLCVGQHQLGGLDPVGIGQLQFVFDRFDLAYVEGPHFELGAATREGTQCTAAGQVGDDRRSNRANGEFGQRDEGAQANISGIADCGSERGGGEALCAGLDTIDHARGHHPGGSRNSLPFR